MIDAHVSIEKNSLSTWQFDIIRAIIFYLEKSKPAGILYRIMFQLRVRIYALIFALSFYANLNHLPLYSELDEIQLIISCSVRKMIAKQFHYRQHISSKCKNRSLFIENFAIGIALKIISLCLAMYRTVFYMYTMLP